MAKTVTSAFNEFLKDYVNLDPSDSATGRSSRDWLIDKIELFPVKNESFPQLYSDRHIAFGSFARKTKIRELDDIDLMICLHAAGAVYNEFTDGIILTVPDSAQRLKTLCDYGTLTLNSKKVINAFILELKTVPQYQKSDIKRNMEAATLDLTSYTWSFDIVPCFFTKPDILNNTYYLIPDGYGKWKKTDPRKDRDRVTNVNKFHDGNLLNVIRIIKYWNKRATMPTMSSYLLETIIVDYYNVNIINKLSPYVDIYIPDILNHISNAVFNCVNDPKGIQGDINSLSIDDKIKISVRASLDYQKALDARNYEGNSNHEASIKKWAEIFGPYFPSYY